MRHAKSTDVPLTSPIVARRDPSLRAIVVNRVLLRYHELADDLSRATSVRAASSITRTREGIALAQDDANFIALFDEDGTPRRAIALPAGEGGRRQFPGEPGKRHKLDLEAATTISTARGELLLQLGSGSTTTRERIAILRPPDSVALVHVPKFYDALRGAADFAGSDLNVEGATHVGEVLRLFSRGNGAVRDEVRPVNASCDVNLLGLLAHLDDPGGTEPPRPTQVVQYDLGMLDGVPLGFTDVAWWKGRLYYSAAAEDSPDVVRDGRVSGSVIGFIEDAHARWAPVTNADGSVFAAKVEGLLPAMRGNALLVVTDPDAPDSASELCTVELRGPW